MSPVQNPVVPIKPYHYVHILILSTNVTRLVLGPQCYVLRNDERVVNGPEPFITILRTQYCIISNPVLRTETGELVFDEHGQVQLMYGDEEIRFSRKPFPLYPGEKLAKEIQLLPVVRANCALRLRALMNFDDHEGVSHLAGEEWLYDGSADPSVVVRKEIEIVGEEEVRIIRPNMALCMRATEECIDRTGVARACGERWLVKAPGAYLPGVCEEVLELRIAHDLTSQIALHMRALVPHTDEFGKYRRCGEEYLITMNDAESHICSVFEQYICTVPITVLDLHQYCVILNPIGDDGLSQLGKKQLVRGPKTFFLQPGEQLQAGIQQSYILQADETLVVRAEERCTSDDHCTSTDSNDNECGSESQKITHPAGARWLIRGPIEYVPPIGLEVIARRKLIALSPTEGVYVRNTQTGKICAVIGQPYMLNEYEQLWEKYLPADVISMLKEHKDPLGDRGYYREKKEISGLPELNLKRVVTFQVPHNAAVQIYDYKEKKVRIELGPNLVLLEPYEQFTVVNLSGGVPKKPNQIRSLCLLLGPDFFVDSIVVETADHARLALKISYNWHFEVPEDRNFADLSRMFSVADFVGDACKVLSSRIRGSVASISFAEFHKNSSQIIQSSIFGLDENGCIHSELVFPQNRLHITSVDVQSVEPVDSRTRDALNKSVQLAIEISTNSQEAAARQEAEELEEMARASLEKQKIESEKAIQAASHRLLEIRVELNILENIGQARALAEAKAESARIDHMEGVNQARMHAEAMEIETEAELERLMKAQTLELNYTMQMDKYMLTHRRAELAICLRRFTSMVKALGCDTICSLATANSEENVHILSVLGLKSALVTNGHTPVNLVDTAHGLIGQLMDVD